MTRCVTIHTYLNLFMRVLNINIFFVQGSTGKLVEDIHTRLERDGHESYVIYGLGSRPKTHTDRIYKMTSNFWVKQYARVARITGLRYNCAYFETIRLTHRIKEINPDVVHLHCMNCSYINPFILLKWLGRHKYKVLVTHHADVTITANCDHAYDCELWKTGCKRYCQQLKREGHYIFVANALLSWKQMKKAFAKVKYLYASGVSTWMTERVKMSPFFANTECRVIENGLDISSFRYNENNVNATLSELKEQDTKIVLHVTPSVLNPLKGGQYVIELAKRMPNAKFVIVGCRNEPLPPSPSNVIYVPYVNSKVELASYYQTADVTLLTSKRESFSLVTAESLCCGTPVVGFKAGAPESIAIAEYASFVEYGDIQNLQKAIELVLDKKYDKAVISKAACQRYDSENMYAQYLSYYRDIISGK